MSRSKIAVSTFGAFLAALGFGAAVMRWAPLETDNAMLLGALLIVPAFVVISSFTLISSERRSWLLCAFLVGLGVIGALA